MKKIRKSFKIAQAAMILLTAAAIFLPQSVSAGGAKPGKVKVSIMSGGNDGDVTALRTALGKVSGIKFKADEIQPSGIRREDAVFTKPFLIELTDTAKTDVGAIAKIVASAETPSRNRIPPALYLVIGFEAGGANDEQLRGTLANVKGVEAKKSWAGDINLWIGLDDSGQGKLDEISRALKDVGIPIKELP